MHRSTLTAWALAAFMLLTGNVARATDWLQFGFDASHTGTNPAEKLLTAANVQYMSLLYSIPLPGIAEGAPVALGNVSTAQGIKDVLFLTLNDGTLIALDAATGAQLWSRFPADTNACYSAGYPNTCKTASSPALDPNRQFVYNFALDGYVHKYHVGDGSEITSGGWPQLATLKPDVEQASSALTFATASNGTTYLYVTHSSHPQLEDSGIDYQGHVTAINLTTGTQVVFNAVCSDQGSVHFVKNTYPSNAVQPDCPQQQQAAGSPNAGAPTGDAGIWGRAGTVYDPLTDVIYISTGNGVFDANNAGHNWSDSVLSLPAALDTPRTAPLDSYTPLNFLTLMYYDIDLGSTSMTLTPAPAGSVYTHIGIQSGKDSNLRIIDLDNMSRAITPGPGQVGGELDSLSVAQHNQVITQPVPWTDPVSGNIFVITANGFGISAMHVTTDSGGTPKLSTASPAWSLSGGATNVGGSSPVIANNVLYYAGANGISALDPATGNTLWNRPLNTPGNIRKQSPIVVNNHVYVADKNGTLWAYLGDEIFPDGFE